MTETAAKLPFSHRLIVPFEQMIKQHFFDCHMCGQCVLSKTHLVCPMGCPKGNRNGPCGGTIDGMCEVLPEKQCVWVEIYERGNCDHVSAPRRVQPPVNRELVGSSSYINLLNGKDKATRLPFSYLKLEDAPRQHNFQTGSALEAVLKSGTFALTAEIQSPRSEKGLSRVEREAQALAGLVDAINATSMAGGVASVDSLTTSDIIRKFGSDPTMQVCGRDVTPNQFTDQLAMAWSHGVRNVFCLTGDWNPNHTAEQIAKDPWPTYFPMESSQMLYEARSIREHGQGGVTQRLFSKQIAPRFFIGGAINPYSSPQSVVFSRLAQKIACGVDFIQTQMVLDVPGFQAWVTELRKTGLLSRVFLLASVPVIVSARALEVCATLPGVKMPLSVQENLMKHVDAEGRLDEAGMAWAEETCLALSHTLGVDGIHLMLLGGQWDKLAGWVARLRKQLVNETANREAII